MSSLSTGVSYSSNRKPNKRSTYINKNTENNNTRQSKNIMAGSALRQPCQVEIQLSKGQSTGAIQERSLNT